MDAPAGLGDYNTGIGSCQYTLRSQMQKAFVQYEGRLRRRAALSNTAMRLVAADVVQVAFGFDGSHAAGSGRRYGVFVHGVLDVTGGEHAGDVGERAAGQSQDVAGGI